MLPQLFAEETEEAVGEPWRQVERVIVATPIPGIVGALAAMRDRPDSTSLLESLDLPALIIVGEHLLILKIYYFWRLPIAGIKLGWLIVFTRTHKKSSGE